MPRIPCEKHSGHNTPEMCTKCAFFSSRLCFELLVFGRHVHESLKDLIFCSNATAPTSKIPISLNFIDLCWWSNWKCAPSVFCAARRGLCREHNPGQSLTLAAILFHSGLPLCPTVCHWHVGPVHCTLHCNSRSLKYSEQQSLTRSFKKSEQTYLLSIPRPVPEKWQKSQPE